MAEQVKKCPLCKGPHELSRCPRWRVDQIKKPDRRERF